MFRLYIIYRITNLLNGHAYIGQTCNTVHRRMVQHRNISKASQGMLICRAIRKYGWENFRVDVIESGVSCSDVADELERYWIRAHETLAPKGYNIEVGGQSKHGVSESTRVKIAETLRGRKHSEERRRNISQSRIGHRQSPETVEKRATALRGKKRTEEMKQRMSAARKGRPLSEQHIANIRAAWEKLGGHPALGCKHSPESVAIRAAKMTGRKLKPHTEEWKAWAKDRFSGSGNPFFGKKHSLESLRKIAEKQRVSYSNPEVKAKMSASASRRTNAFLQTPEGKEHIRKMLLARRAVGYKTPTDEWKLGASLRAKEVWRKRKEASCLL